MPHAPALGSAAPKTSRPTRAATRAPAHIGQGSSVTTSVTSSSRQVPEGRRGVPQRQDLGVRGRVAAPLPLVVPGGDDPAVRAARRRPTGTSPWASGRAPPRPGPAPMRRVVGDACHGRARRAGRSTRRRSPSAEEVGFEPTVGFPTHDFQSCRFGRSRTPPGARPVPGLARERRTPAVAAALPAAASVRRMHD